MIELKHISTERIFDWAERFQNRDKTAKTIYDLFVKYDIIDFQKLKDLMTEQKQEFESVSYALRRELYGVEFLLKEKNELGIEPEIFTFDRYQSSKVDIQTLQFTDQENYGDILLYSCPTIRGGARINRLKPMSIEEIKYLASHLSQYHFDNSLSTRITFGIDTVKRVVECIKYYEEQVLRQAQETEERGINLFLLNKEEKDEIVESQYKEIIEYILDNAEKCIWGNLPSSKKIQMLRTINAIRGYGILEDRRRLVNAISNYTTLGELKQGVVKKRTLDRFIVK